MQRLALIMVLWDLSLFSYKITNFSPKISITYPKIRPNFMLEGAEQPANGVLPLYGRHFIVETACVKVRIIYIYISIGKLNNLS
jgi:hypothetical protein